MTLERLYAALIGMFVLVTVTVGLWAFTNVEWLLGVGALVGGAALTVSSGIGVRGGRHEQKTEHRRENPLPLVTSRRSV